MTLKSVIGNSSVKELLCHSLESDRIGHAYIIEGKRGVGRMTIAKAFSAEILKTDNPDTHPDFTIVTNQLYDGSKKQDNVLVETIRCLKKDAYIRPYYGNRKIYVVPNADTMQAPAQNSLLKIFEEPPHYCTIILLCENANAFLPTILSRALVLRLHPLSNNEVYDYLINKKGIEPNLARQLSILSGGAIGRALELLDDQEIIQLRDETLNSFIPIFDGGCKELYDFIRYLKKNKTQIYFIMDIIQSISQDIMYLKFKIGDICNADKLDKITAMCNSIPREAALHFNEISIKYRKFIEQNVNYSAAMLCMATEFWEEIHGRNYRS